MAKSVTLNKTMDEYRKDFYKIYNSTIIPILKKYEVERKEKLKKLRIYWGALGILCLITGYYAFNLNGITEILLRTMRNLSVVSVISVGHCYTQADKSFFPTERTERTEIFAPQHA